MKTILVATDFSDTAQSALDWAIELAQPHGACIDLVHALPLLSRSADYLPSPPDMNAELNAAAVKRLDKTAARVRDRRIEVRTHLITGLPSEKIVEAAATADLIIIGTLGLTGVSHLLLGSTAERVVQRAPCPVLTVHPGDIDQHRQVKTVLVPTDFSDNAQLAIRAALTLLRPQNEERRLLLMHAYHLPFEYTAYGTIPTSFNYMKDVEGECLEKLQAIAAGIDEENLSVEVVAIEGYPPDTIVAEANRAAADLIAMGLQGRSRLAHLLLGSTAERVIQLAGCPVLTTRSS